MYSFPRFFWMDLQAKNPPKKKKQSHWWVVVLALNNQILRERERERERESLLHPIPIQSITLPASHQPDL
jgi:hypothetical protein